MEEVESLGEHPARSDEGEGQVSSTSSSGKEEEDGASGTLGVGDKDPFNQFSFVNYQHLSQVRVGGWEGWWWWC